MTLEINNKVIVNAAIASIKNNLLAAQKSTRGAIIIDTSIASGDFLSTMLFDTIGEIERRDPDNNPVITPTELNNLKGTSPKIYLKKYVIYRYSELARYGANFNGVQVQIGKDLGKAIVEYILIMGLNALKGAFESNTDAIYSSSNSELTIKDINAGVFKFGDMAQDIIALVTPSVTVKNLIDNAIDSTADQIAYGAVYNSGIGTLGRSIWSVDADVLLDDDKEIVFGLAKGALRISESEVVQMFSHQVVNTENTGVGIKTEGAYTIDVKGYSYDVAKGSNPDKATLKDGDSWSIYRHLKSSAGVMVKGA